MSHVISGLRLRHWLKFLVLAAGCGSFASHVNAAVKDPVFGSPVSNLQVPLGQSRILLLDDTVRNISLGDPNVADVLVLDARKIYVVGKSLGSTNVVLWGKEGDRTDYNTFKVEVTHDLESLKRTLHEIMPEEKPEVRSAQGAIILAGEVSSPAKVDAVTRLATQFVNNAKKYSLADKQAQGGEKGAQSSEGLARSSEVINMLQVGGPHQVMLEVKVAEVSRTVMRHLGVNMWGYNHGSPWKIGAVNGGARFPNALIKPGDVEVPVFPTAQGGNWADGQSAVIGPNVDVFDPTMPAISAAGMFFNWMSGDSLFNLVIDAAKEDGLAKILAEPTLTTLSGEAASFLSGGEFPVPMWSGDDDKITVIFKEYGISMKALPTVLDSKRINLNLEITVSELTDAASITARVPTMGVSYSIPSLASRSANSTVELLDGQTIGIAGLISDKMREAITKFPGLGDIPVLGTLFRSQDYIQDQSELVMFVTARLAKPIAPEKIRLPTDSFRDPSDAEFFLLGRLQGKKPEKDERDSAKTSVDNKTETTVKQPQGNGGPTFGHQL